MTLMAQRATEFMQNIFSNKNKSLIISGKQQHYCKPNKKDIIHTVELIRTYCNHDVGDIYQFKYNFCVWII